MSAVQYNIGCHGELDEPPVLECLFIDGAEPLTFLIEGIDGFNFVI